MDNSNLDNSKLLLNLKKIGISSEIQFPTKESEITNTR